MTYSATILPDLTIKRILHSVGQGAFYSETFWTGGKAIFTVVYDCGGYKDKLESEIETLPESIDILFVSHFHTDHINGIEYLLKLKKVNQVVFPNISPSRFLVDFVRNCTKGDAASLSFMYRILPALKSYGNGVKDDRTPYKPISSEEQYFSPNADIRWEYISFYNGSTNFQNAEMKLLEKLTGILTLPAHYKTAFLDEKDYKRIADAINNNPDLVKNIKLIYSNTIPGGHNAYSMLVLSHEVNADGGDLHSFDCLYTGDAKIDKWALDIKNNYAPEYIQVPHHGSKYSNDDNLYSDKQIAFISVGENNRYRHPAVHVVKNILETCKQLILATES